MMSIRFDRSPILVALLATLAVPVRAGDELAAARAQRQRAVQALVHTSGDDALQRFLDEHVASELLQGDQRAELLERARKIRAIGARAGAILAEPLGDDGARIVFEDDDHRNAVTLRVARTAPHRIDALTVVELPPSGPTAADAGPPITWENLEASLRSAEHAGFSGTVLIVRNDQVICHEGFGLASRETKTPNTKDTIFAVGSVPIDFTKAAILKLEDLGQLSTADPIAKFLPQVPDDKRAITIEQLMTGRSGLPNFHHLPGVDADPDLTWIDRDTALKRILGQQLLFAPGTERAHSHSAWVLLAAIVEIVSHETYEQFLAEHFFGPAGMERTGDHHFVLGFDEDEIAVGYGSSSHGKINTPAYWGETSWLVKGSGGMVSNPGDLYRWVCGIRSGGLLSARAQKKFWTGGGPLAGGDDRGFLCMYTEGPGTMMFLCTNSHRPPGDEAQRLARRLVALVMGETAGARKSR